MAANRKQIYLLTMIKLRYIGKQRSCTLNMRGKIVEMVCTASVFNNIAVVVRGESARWYESR